MPEIPVQEPLSETATHVAKVKDGLTADDVPPEITAEAARPQCLEHPDAGWCTGAGYDGGGFGPYKICLECGTVFGKTQWKDGNQND